MSRRQLYLFYAFLGLAIIALDQVTKYLVVQQIALGARVTLLQNFLELTLLHNRGGAFGVGDNWVPWVRILFFYLISGVAVVVIGWMLVKADPVKERLAFASLVLILSGAFGNIIDRVRLGYVIDFVYMHWYGHYWPAYNVADSAITIGAILLGIHLLWPKAKKS